MHCSKKNMTHVTAIHLIIHGRVQGVGYRAWTGSTARKLGLKGWVRNRTDSTVEAVLIGDAATIGQMVEACREGPLNARVDTIIRGEWTDMSPEDFRQLPTA
jgi:acylphosphatase